MKSSTIGKIGKINLLIIVISLWGLILFSILPLVAEDHSISSDLLIPDFKEYMVEKNLDTIKIHYNYNTLQKSTNVEIQNIANKTDSISIFFWLILIFAFLSIIEIGAILLEIITKYKKIIILVGCILTSLSGLLLIYYNLDLILYVGTINGISASTVNFLNAEFKYLYIPTLIGVVSFILTLPLYLLTLYDFKKTKKKKESDLEKDIDALLNDDNVNNKKIERDRDSQFNYPKITFDVIREKKQIDTEQKEDMVLLDNKTDDDILKKETMSDKIENKEPLLEKEKTVVNVKEERKVDISKELDEALSKAIEKKKGKNKGKI